MSNEWPRWTMREHQIGLDAIVRLIDVVQRRERGEKIAGHPLSINCEVRQVVRALGFTDRNSVGVLADMIQKQINS